MSSSADTSGSGSDSGFTTHGEADLDQATAAAITLTLSRSPTITKQKPKEGGILPDMEFPVPPRPRRASRGEVAGPARPGTSRSSRRMSTGSRSGPEERLLSVRRSNHRDYEQRRRNSIKEQFDGLRMCIPALRSSSAHISKQRILREAHDHIAYLLTLSKEGGGGQEVVELDHQLSEQQLRRLALSRDCDEIRSRVEALKMAKGIKFEPMPNLVDADGSLTDVTLAYSVTSENAMQLDNVPATDFYPMGNNANIKDESNLRAQSRTPPTTGSAHHVLNTIAEAAAS